MIRVVCVCLVVLVILLASILPAFALRYEITDLTSLGLGWMNDINNSGVVLGSTATGVGLLDEGDGRSDLTGGTGGNAINDHGEVVGFSYGGEHEYAVSWGSTDSMHDLGSIGGWYSEAKDINNLGQIVGWSDTPGPGGMYGGSSHWAMWDDTGVRDLGTFNMGPWGEAWGINDSGQVVGYVYGDDYRNHAVLWQDGRGAQDLVGIPSYRSNYAQAINRSGQVCGWAENSTFDAQAFVWSSTDGVLPLGMLPGYTASLARGINSQGWVVGHSLRSDQAKRAFIWRDGVMTDLNDLVDPSSGWVLYYATAINDSGQIVGYGNKRGFLLTPVPEPSGFIALMAGITSAVCGLRRKHRQC